MKKHLEFYMQCMKNGCIMPVVESEFDGGLCSIADVGLIDNSLFEELFVPENAENARGYWADIPVAPDLFWAYGRFLAYGRRYKFNELRQTIVLLMAAYNGEL